MNIPPLTHEQLPEPAIDKGSRLDVYDSMTYGPYYTADQVLEVAAQRDQAWREALEKVEPVVTIHKWHKHGDTLADLLDWEDGFYGLPAGEHKLYATPQPDRVAGLEAEVARLQRECEILSMQRASLIRDAGTKTREGV